MFSAFSAFLHLFDDAGGNFLPPGASRAHSQHRGNFSSWDTGDTDHKTTCKIASLQSYFADAAVVPSGMSPPRAEWELTRITVSKWSSKIRPTQSTPLWPRISARGFAGFYDCCFLYVSARHGRPPESSKALPERHACRNHRGLNGPPRKMFSFIQGTPSQPGPSRRCGSA